MLSVHLLTEKQRLLDLIAAIRNSGTVAPAYCFLSPMTTTSKAGKTYEYARLVTQSRAIHKQTAKSLGRAGSGEHRLWERAIARRDAIAELEQQLQLLARLIDRQEARRELTEQTFQEPQ